MGEKIGASPSVPFQPTGFFGCLGKATTPCNRCHRAGYGHGNCLQISSSSGIVSRCGVFPSRRRMLQGNAPSKKPSKPNRASGSCSKLRKFTLDWDCFGGFFHGPRDEARCCLPKPGAGPPCLCDGGGEWLVHERYGCPGLGSTFGRSPRDPRFPLPLGIWSG